MRVTLTGEDWCQSNGGLECLYADNPVVFVM